MKTEETIAYTSMAVIVVSLFFIGVELTGHALTDTGVVNVTIASSASLYFQTALLDFSNGSVTPGQTAIIDSESGNNGNWEGDSVTGELILENNGNENVSFTLKANKTAQVFIGGGGGAAFKVKVSENETNSCGIAGNAIANFTSYQDITTTEQLACSNLGSDDATDTVMIDAELTIPSDAAGAKTVGIIATGTIAG